MFSAGLRCNCAAGGSRPACLKSAAAVSVWRSKREAPKTRQRVCFLQGRAQFLRIQKFAALVFAVVQSVGQLSYIRPYVTDFSPFWFADSVATLTAGAMILVLVSHPHWLQAFCMRGFVA